MNVEELRISKLRNYLFGIIDGIVKDKNYQINANMLSNDINSYSLDLIPENTIVVKWIIGGEVHKNVYSLRSRMPYSQDVMNNLSNVGFFEIFANIIKTNNNNGVLPDIEGIESIECLTYGSMVDATTNTCSFDIQLQITYRVGG